MKRRLAAAFAALAMVAGAADLESDFLSPPQSRGPWAWWHWCGSNVSRAGITRVSFTTMTSPGRT